jgi:hypothetical protein
MVGMLYRLIDVVHLSFAAEAMSGFKSLLQRELEDDSSSDDDDYFIMSAAQIVQTFSGQKRKPGGSVPGHLVIYRDREGGHQRMFEDYLVENPTYGPHLFRQRFVLVHL